MPQEKDSKGKRVGDSFSEMFEAFGKAMGEILNNPELKSKARQLGESATQSAETLARRFQDEEVKKKFRELGKAARKFGDDVADYFGEKSSGK